jgi:hypothetical protein
MTHSTPPTLRAVRLAGDVADALRSQLIGARPGLAYRF